MQCKCSVNYFVVADLQVVYFRDAPISHWPIIGRPC